ncbi:unnamed protein product [Zymoseptoria tritici ST99CH_3D1]|uniref:CBM1 domain-containing protein n=2 Tax=Zymoseptoria tritici TaxID=1047171 RepID=A0A1X7RHN3_ZYMT9|nr:unnamed protein product [Zymoseptoria tritici ST99CH_3D7]SMR43284.1 unnamed protein product [Zymoseptoria tritici ST99CH_1E4]SMR45448.1 unnamed protein product [Zymoseptoria tritici ST99CH_3D1]
MQILHISLFLTLLSPAFADIDWKQWGKCSGSNTIATGGSGTCNGRGIVRGSKNKHIPCWGLSSQTTFANRRDTIASRWTTRGERRIVVSREGREGRGGREMGMLSVVERG